MKKYTYKRKWKQNYNETALATIAIVPDDGPVWPKHVVLEKKLTSKFALKTAISNVRVCIYQSENTIK
jgi:hypothetical protein